MSLRSCHTLLVSEPRLVKGEGRSACGVVFTAVCRLSHQLSLLWSRLPFIAFLIGLVHATEGSSSSNVVSTHVEIGCNTAAYNSHTLLQQQQQQPDSDSDMAFAMALDQEERRLFEARRSSAAATLSTEQGAFGSKIRVAGIPSPGSAATFPGSAATAATQQPQRWGVADAEAMMDRGEGMFPSESDDDGDGGGLEEGGEGDGGGGFRAVPGGGRRKGKMPLFKNAEGEVVSKHDALICGR